MQADLKFQINSAAFGQALRQYALATKISFADAIRRQARLIAVNLAFQTQPYGDQGRVSGENAIRKDLVPPRGIFKPLNKTWMSEAIRMRDYAPENFVRRFTNKNGQAWLTEQDQVLTTQGAIKDFHQSMRTKGGRKKTSKAGTFTRDIGRHGSANRGIVDQAQLTNYITKVQKKVGIAKAGWAACAKKIGGTRGIPQWVTRHAGKKATGTVNDQSDASEKQYVTMTNMVPWIDQCLNGGQIQKALDIQKGKMLNAIRIALSRAK